MRKIYNKIICLIWRDFGLVIRKRKSKRRFLRFLDHLTISMGAEYISFSQNLEDVVLVALCDKRDGFYVDVGAHNPFKYSNTYLLWLRGWKGINIDPLPGCKELFDKARPGDINIACGVSESEELLYYNFKGGAYNTCNRELGEKYVRESNLEMVEKKTIPTKKLSQIFSEYVSDKKIDIMNIDVETMELDVLRSNDWSKWRPTYIVIESLNTRACNIISLKDEVIDYLVLQNYKVVAKVMDAVFFMDTQND